MKKIMQLPDGSLKEVEIIAPEKRVNASGNHLYVISFEDEGKYYNAIIEKVNNAWMIKQYTNISELLESSDHVSMEWDLAEELPERMMIYKGPIIEEIATPSQRRTLDDFAENKQQLVSFLQFLQDWYPSKESGVSETVDQVRRYVIKSKVEWPLDVMCSIIPNGQVQGYLNHHDLRDKDNVLLILNNILINLKKDPNEVALPRRYAIQRPGYQWTGEFATEFFEPSLSIEGRNAGIQPETKQRENYYVAVIGDIISMTIQNKDKREIAKQVRIYEGPSIAEWIPIDKGTTVVDFQPTATFIRGEKLSQYVMDALKFEDAFGQQFFPPLEIETPNSTKVYHFAFCQSKEKGMMFQSQDVPTIETYYSDAEGVDYPSDSGPKIYGPELFEQAVGGARTMKLISYDNSEEKTFPGYKDSQFRPPQARI